MKTAFIIFFLIPLILCAEIVEIKNISQVKEHIRDDALIIWDIDNTLIEPVQMLGSDQWFNARWTQLRKEMEDQSLALETALAEWMAVQNVSKMRLVEEEVKGIIEALQKKGVRMMGLTTRGLGLCTRTLHQLKELGIDLIRTAPSAKEIHFMNGQGVLFRNGVLFTANTHKGNALAKLFEEIRFKPSRVIFINDKKSNLEQAETYAIKRRIPFLGLRYGFLDEKVKNFSMEIADKQFETFGHILSDCEANLHLNKK